MALRGRRDPTARPAWDCRLRRGAPPRSRIRRTRSARCPVRGRVSIPSGPLSKQHASRRPFPTSELLAAPLFRAACLQVPEVPKNLPRAIPFREWVEHWIENPSPTSGTRPRSRSSNGSPVTAPRSTEMQSHDRNPFTAYEPYEDTSDAGAEPGGRRRSRCPSGCSAG